MTPESYPRHKSARLEGHNLLAGRSVSVAVAVRHARGSPERPMDAAAQARKVARLAPQLAGALEDPGAPALDVADAAGLV